MDLEKKNACRVIVVEDHPIVRFGLAMSIDVDPMIKHCGECDNAADAWRLAIQQVPDVVIVDLGLRAGSGFELIEQLRRWRPTIGIVVSTMHRGPIYESRARRAGAHAYVCKDQDTVELLSQVKATAWRLASGKGETLTPLESGGDVLGRLTNREVEVFQLIGNGLATREIAAHMHLGIKTVETYKGRIKQKLSLGSASELAREAVLWTSLSGHPKPRSA